VTFISNVLSKSTSGAAMTYTGIQAGYWVETISDVSIYNTQVENGATSAITWVGQGIKQIAVGTIFNVTVVNASNLPVSGAQVFIVGTTGEQILSAITNASGQLTGILAATTSYSQPTANSGQITVTQSGPLTVSVTLGGTTTTVLYDPNPSHPLKVILP
jgi:hypothetical protein